jgi:hypothetical protein
MLDSSLLHFNVAPDLNISMAEYIFSYTFCTYSEAQQTFSSMLSAPKPETILKTVQRGLLQITVYLP